MAVSEVSAQVRQSLRLLLGAAAVLLCATALAQAQQVKLGHPTVEERIAKQGIDPKDGYRFVVFGDQKGLWKKDFPTLIEQVHRLADTAGELPLLFMIDTGDIVDDGRKLGQFRDLRKHLARVSYLPYLVAVGNHELKPKQDKRAPREHTATFLTGLDPDFSPDRMYYAKTIGPIRFLFLNSSDFPGLYSTPGAPDRHRAQMEWLARQLETEAHPTIVSTHHPIVQSAAKHRGQARHTWNHEYGGGQTLPEVLLDGGVDLVLSGHVHSYEIFHLERDGKQMWSVNVSGKPKGLTTASRRPRNWAGKEMEELAKAGFETRLEAWQIKQEDYLQRDEEANQFALITVGRDGNLDVEIRSIDASEPLHSMRIEKR
jgi:hypothetical protein